VEGCLIAGHGRCRKVLSAGSGVLAQASSTSRTTSHVTMVQEVQHLPRYCSSTAEARNLSQSRAACTSRAELQQEWLQ